MSELYHHPIYFQLICMYRLPEDGFESDSSDIFVMSLEQPSTDEPFSLNRDGAGPVASSDTAAQESGNKISAKQTTVRLRSLGSRHVLVKDTAFQT